MKKTRSRSRYDFSTLGVFLALGLFVASLTYDVLLTRRYTGFWDNHSRYAAYQIFFSRIFSGTLALWSPSLNAGSPIWILTETQSLFDPVAWIVFSFCRLANVSGFQAFQICLGLWIVLFAVGVFSALRAIGKGLYSSFLAALVCSGSYLTLQSFYCADGVILHAHWLPWLVWGMVRLYEKPSSRRGFAFGVALGIVLSGYTAVVNATILLVGLVVVIAFKLLPKWRSDHATAFSFAALGFAPFLFSLIVVSRSAHSSFAMDRFASSRMTPPHGILNFIRPWLGLYQENNPALLESFFFPGGLTYAVLIFAGLAWAMRIKKGKFPSVSPITKALLVFSLIVGILFSGLFEPFFLALGLEGGWFHNRFQFFQPYLLCATAALAAIAVEDLQQHLKKISLSKISLLTASIFAGVAALGIIYAGHISFFRLLLPFVLAVAALLVSFRFRKDLAPLLCFGLVVELTISHALWKPGTLPLLPEWVARREPKIISLEKTFPEVRVPLFPAADFAPFEKEGPAVWGMPSLALELNVSRHTASKAPGFPEKSPSHMFRSRSYESLMNGPLETDVLKVWGGTTSHHVLRLYFCAADLNESVRHLAGERGLLTKRAGFSDGIDPNTAYFVGRAFSSVSSQLPLPSASGCHVDASHSEISRLSSSPTKVTLKVTTDRPSLVYFADAFDDNWVANINGKATDVLRTNLNFKSVLVPTGTSEVVLAYRPMLYIRLFFIRALWVASAFGCALWPFMTRRRKFAWV